MTYRRAPATEAALEAAMIPSCASPSVHDTPPRSRLGPQERPEPRLHRTFVPDDGSVDGGAAVLGRT